MAAGVAEVVMKKEVQSAQNVEMGHSVTVQRIDIE